MSLKNNILKVFSANFLSMVSGIIVSFLVPAILSVESYSYLKTYTFYVSYITFFSLGFVDGMYIKYGGKTELDVIKQDYKSEHNFFMILQGIFTLIFLIIGIVQKNYVIIIMSLTIIPVNLSGFYKMYYQAIGNFSIYSKAYNLYTLTYLLFNVLLVIVFKSSNYLLYCLTTLVGNSIVLIIFEYNFYKETKSIKSSLDKKVLNNIKVGFFILIGNLSVMLFYAIDRWFIKIFFDSTSFAYYSFAISMLNVINLLVNSISVTFYNYLSKGEDTKKIQKFKKYFLILGGVSSLAYFAFAAIIDLFLNKYSNSLTIIAISFAAYPYIIIINALYVNLYKARKNEKKYVKVVMNMVIISAIYNIIAMVICKKPQSIAVATTASFITWYLYSVKDFKYLKPDIKECIYLGILLISFIIFSHFFNWFIGGIGYLIVLCIFNFIMYKVEIFEIIHIILKRDKKYIKRTTSDM